MTLIHLREEDGEVVQVPEAEAEYSVDVPEERVVEWDAAEVAYRAAARRLGAAHAEMAALYDAAESEALAALPPRDPDAPPPGPIRDLFPAVSVAGTPITFGGRS
jgi:hypothetical protein